MLKGLQISTRIFSIPFWLLYLVYSPLHAQEPNKDSSSTKQHKQTFLFKILTSHSAEISLSSGALFFNTLSGVTAYSNSTYFFSNSYISTNSNKYSIENSFQMHNNFNHTSLELGLGIANKVKTGYLYVGKRFFPEKKINFTLSIGANFIRGKLLGFTDSYNYYTGNTSTIRYSSDSFFGHYGIKSLVKIKIGEKWNLGLYGFHGFDQISSSLSFKNKFNIGSSGAGILVQFKIKEKTNPDSLLKNPPQFFKSFKNRPKKEGVFGTKNNKKKSNAIEFSIGTGLQFITNNNYILGGKIPGVNQRSFGVNENGHYSKSMDHVIFDVGIAVHDRFFVNGGYLLSGYPLVLFTNESDYTERRFIRVAQKTVERYYNEIGVAAFRWKQSLIIVSGYLQYNFQDLGFYYSSGGNLHYNNWSMKYTTKSFHICPRLTWKIKFNRTSLDFFVLHPLYVKSKMSFDYSYNSYYNSTKYYITSNGNTETNSTSGRLLLQYGIKFNFLIKIKK